MKKNERQGTIFVIIAGICWGMIGLFTRRLSAVGFDSFQVTFLRNLFAAVALLIYILVKDKRFPKIAIKDWWMFVGTGICSVAFFNCCYFKSIEMTTMSVAAVLLYTAPCMVMVMSCVFFKEKITGVKVAALIIAFVGCVFTTGLIGNCGSISGIGVLIGLGSGFGYALYSIFGTFAARKYDSYTISFYTFLFAAVGLLPFSHPGKMSACLSKDLILYIIVVALLLATISTVVPFVCYTNGLKSMPAGKASVMAFIEPMVATILGIVIYHEGLTVLNITGIVFIFASVCLLNYQEEKG